jgi:flagellar biosynthesis/type III secretory pathway chaperone
MTNDTTLDRVEAFLERERAILLSGRIAELAELADAREEMLQALADESADSQRIRRLREKATRNGALLEAASEGVKRAMKRLADLRKAAGPIGSYSAGGGRCEIGAVNPKFERKA